MRRKCDGVPNRATTRANVETFPRALLRVYESVWELQNVVLIHKSMTREGRRVIHADRNGKKVEIDIPDTAEFEYHVTKQVHNIINPMPALFILMGKTLNFTDMCACIRSQIGNCDYEQLAEDSFR